MGVESKLCDLAQAEIDDLVAKGINLSPAEIVEINYLASRVETPHTRIHLARGVPVFVAGVALWPLTMYSADWYCRVGCNLKSPYDELSLGYAMAHAYDQCEALDCNDDDALRIVKRWVKSMRCTRAALIEAVQQVTAQDQKPPVPQNTQDELMTMGDFSAALAAMTGESPEFWERRCAVSYCHSVLAAIMMQNRADKKPCPLDPRIGAERALGYAIDRIRKSREVSNG